MMSAHCPKEIKSTVLSSSTFVSKVNKQALNNDSNDFFYLKKFSTDIIL